jgi:transposase
MAKDDGVTVATVKGGTERYADALGVALPKRARGRPRKAANRAQAFPS